MEKYKKNFFTAEVERIKLLKELEKTKAAGRKRISPSVVECETVLA